MMPITYTNRRNQTYYLHQGTTKTGKPKYYFSQKSEGKLVDTIPEGFEIYENPNAQVFLRRIQPKLITDEEIEIVRRGMERYCKVPHFKIDVKKNVISIFMPNQNVEALSALVAFAAREGRDLDLETLVNYSPELNFVLIDAQKRRFMTQRYCYLGSIDDWIDIGAPDTLANLVKTYVKHLGQESYYELY